MSRYSCQDPQHVGPRYISSVYDAYEERIEFRRLYDQRDRRNVRVMAPICRACRDARILRAKGGRMTQQGALFHEA